jgi:hypothetical protein
MDDAYQQLMNMIAKEITYSLSQNKYDNGLLSGKLGEAIFLYEYSIYNPQYYEYANQILDQVYESVYKGNIFHTYCNGLAGICIGIYYLQDRKIIEPFDFVSKEIDCYLEEKLKECVVCNNYDFLHGAIGIGFYFIERINKGNIKLIGALKQVIDYIDKNAIIENDLIKWAKINAKTASYDISLSHGISSIIIFLCQLLSIKNINNYVNTTKIKRLINGAVKYILSQKINVNKYRSYFPYTSVESSQEIKGSRLAWCYGDLGISMILLEVAVILNNKIYSDIAINILNYSCIRRNLHKNFVFDSGLCHGTSGIALIFYKLFYKTNNFTYLNTAKYWIDRTLEYCNPSKGIDTFKIYYDAKHNVWQKNLSLLEGLSGIGLTLLSFYYKENPFWSKFLLLS